MYQRITIIGRLGRDPEMRYLANGEAVTTLSVATDFEWKDKDGQKQKDTTWFRVTAFGKQAEAANQYLSKGKMVMVDGRLRSDPKTGGPAIYQRQDGTHAANFEIIANSVLFLSPRSAETKEESPSTEDDILPSGEDIPF